MVNAALSPLGSTLGSVQVRLNGHNEVPQVRMSGGHPILLRILRNLLLNACEGDGTRGARHIEIRLSPKPGEASALLEVIDDGPGFPPELLAAAPAARYSTKPEGSGLGLWLVRALLGSQADTLRMRNAPGGGAVVSFELPTWELV